MDPGDSHRVGWYFERLVAVAIVDAGEEFQPPRPVRLSITELLTQKQYPFSIPERPAFVFMCCKLLIFGSAIGDRTRTLRLERAAC
jgi:hypothetical protein